MGSRVRDWAFLGATLVAGCQGSGGPDMILTGGLVRTGPSAAISGPGTPTALAIRGGRVMAVGSDREISALAGASTEHVALEGRRVVPGS